jgi:mono/diheme cytochrome c family protein
MRHIKLGRTGIGIAVFACAIALAAPAALAIRATVSTPANPGPGNIASGQTLFNEQFCAACHTLKAAGADAYGQLGVNLNDVKGGVPFETAKAVVLNGLPAALPLYPTQMVGYKDVLSSQQVDDVSTFVSRYSGTRVTCDYESSKPNVTRNCTTG